MKRMCDRFMSLVLSGTLKSSFEGQVQVHLFFPNGAMLQVNFLLEENLRGLFERFREIRDIEVMLKGTLVIQQIFFR